MLAITKRCFIKSRTELRLRVLQYARAVLSDVDHSHPRTLRLPPDEDEFYELLNSIGRSCPPTSVSRPQHRQSTAKASRAEATVRETAAFADNRGNKREQHLECLAKVTISCTNVGHSLGIRDGREDRGMYCTITAGLLLSSVSITSLPCSDFDQTIDFDQIAEVEKPRVAEVEKAKVQVASLDHGYVPLPPSQPKKSEIKIGTTTINLEQSNIKNMSLLVVYTPDNVLKTSVASEHAGKFVCLLKKLVVSGYPIKDIGGYSYRKIFGTNYLSLHAHGKALDVNQVRYNEVTVRQPKQTIEMAHECGLDFGAEWRNSRYRSF